MRWVEVYDLFFMLSIELNTTWVAWATSSGTVVVIWVKMTLWNWPKTIWSWKFPPRKLTNMCTNYPISWLPPYTILHSNFSFNLSASQIPPSPTGTSKTMLATLFEFFCSQQLSLPAFVGDFAYDYHHFMVDDWLIDWLMMMMVIDWLTMIAWLKIFALFENLFGHRWAGIPLSALAGVHSTTTMNYGLIKPGCPHPSLADYVWIRYKKLAIF